MSFARLATPVRAAARTSIPRSRAYATAPSSGGSNLPLYLAAAGAAGLGGYVYLQRNPQVGKKLEARAESIIDSWEDEKKVSGAENAVSALIKDSWVPFKLTKVDAYNHNTKIYTFDIGENKLSGGEVAYLLMVQAEGDAVKDDKGKPVARPYTPISSPYKSGTMQLLIKEYEGGKLTPYIASLKPGDTLQFKGPYQKFVYKPNSFERGLCIAGGSGITPMWQLINASLQIPEDKTKWTLVFSNVSEKDILMRDEWDALAKKHADRLSVKYVIDKVDQGTDWKGETGYVTPEIIQKSFPKGSDKTRVFVCGPPGQVKAIAGAKDGPRQGELQGILKELGYTADDVFKY